MPVRHFDGHRVRTERAVARLTQADLAERVGVTRTAVASWERGATRPDGERLPVIAEALGKSIDDLFPREGGPDLVDLRCDAGYAQYQIGGVVPRSAGPVGEAERGARRLDDALLAPLAAAYGVSQSVLLDAQERSFGADVPVAPAPAAVTAVPKAVPTTIAEKINYLLEETYGSNCPTDAQVAEAGNGEVPGVLDADLVRGLRTGTTTGAADEVLDALARAFDVPRVFFRSDSVEVARVVAAVRAAQTGLNVMAARGGEDGLPAELLDFVTDAFSELLAEPEQGQES
ncbi:helix-turn-helix transcriptional regulator [Streptomyces jumonjinensis]|uniref:helix-turn-helix transcriptional regulator n=1 Tax=Streptomyces jumonjinensis TaxID=1945 RepID=UPI00378F7531